MTDARSTLGRYFDAFNAGDTDGMPACLAPDLEHHVNEGAIRLGKAPFAAFCAHMSRCYAETLTDIVLFVPEGGRRGAAEYVVTGTYLQTDDDLPAARGQTYRLPVGSFFSLEDGLITRVVTNYNLADWTRQVS